MVKVQHVFTALALTAAGCSSPASDAPAPEAPVSAVSAEIAAVASAAAPGITIEGGEPNASNTEFEVTGTMPDGEEVELDLVQSNGTWSVLEIQRDVAWSSVPEPVRAAAAAAPNAFEPVRVIESTQAADGSVVFELFSPTSQDGGPSRGPAMEVRWHDGKAEVISDAS